MFSWYPSPSHLYPLVHFCPLELYIQCKSNLSFMPWSLMYLKRTVIPDSSHSTSKFWFSRLSIHSLHPVFVTILICISLHLLQFVNVFTQYSLQIFKQLSMPPTVPITHTQVLIKTVRLYQKCLSSCGPEHVGSLLLGLCFACCALLTLDFLPYCGKAL